VIGKVAAPLANKALAPYIDELARSVSGGGRLEDAVRAVAMRMRGADPSDFRMSHRPPSVGDDVAAPLSNLDSVYPADVYTRPRIYASSPEELAVAPLARMVRGKPDELVDMYRAVPRWVSDIDTGDWVTPSLGYARRHADIIRRPDVPTVILRGRVPAGKLLTQGDSLAEFGYAGSRIAPAQRLGAPRIPRSVVEAALAGDREALRRIANLYGLESISKGLVA
jgi:hypothetical protein